MIEITVDSKVVEVPSAQEIRRGVEAFHKNETWNCMYKIASHLVDEFWGRFQRSDPITMGDALGVLLLTWNNAFYRYGELDLKQLDQCLSRNFPVIKGFRLRAIDSFCREDEAVAGALFEDFLNALRLAGTSTRSPVATAKALHLLAPAFFPLWDVKIAKHYRSFWYHSDNGVERYLFFCKVARAVAQREASTFADETETFVKIFDEFNYAKFTAEWI